MELVLLEELQEGHLRDVGCNGLSINNSVDIVARVSDQISYTLSQ